MGGPNLIRIGKIAVDPDQIIYIDDGTNDPSQGGPDSAVTIHLRDTRHFYLYGDDAKAARAYVATFPAPK